ncbi:hypothetical protein AVEN_218366-1 [Araneus ventricosus]|uniref:Integrase catalytic domain-containing protein n=1 Tax=Araneus ventricosus TaxID=182803 RepID=A0A4Y2BBK5_ARAVE|nr:hypothetical protein AVEN_218366-1 [Araneus ventricosus]
MAEEQQTDPELQDSLSSSTTLLVLQSLPVGEPPVTLHCDVSLGRIRPFVRENFRLGPLTPSEGFGYCLTCVDRFSKWPEAFPLVDISANTIATAFYSGWISRFGPPLRLTTDQGTQFESALFQALTKFSVLLDSAQHHTIQLRMVKWNDSTDN